MDTPDDDQTLPDDLTVPEGMVADDEFANPFVEAAPPPARWPLAIVAALVVGAVGVVVWGVASALFTRALVGMSVLVGLLVGYVVREVSRRSNLPARIVAVAVTAVVCFAGAFVGDAAYVSADTKTFGVRDLLDSYKAKPFEHFKDRPKLQFLIFAVALVVAYLAAGPAKPKAAATDATDDTDDETEADSEVEPDDGAGQSAT